MSLERLSQLSAGGRAQQPPTKAPEPQEAEPSTPAQIVEEVNEEYQTLQKELQEIEMLIRQSSSEVEKLAQRNTQLTNKLQAMEANIDTLPRQDIKEIYNGAREAQMRLFMMRSQVEKLQSRQENLQRYAETLEKVLEVSDTLVSSAASRPAVKAPKNGSEGAEGSGIIRIINAQESERQSLANQLHDGPAQSLTNLILQAEICERLFDSDPGRARTELSELKQAVTNTFQKVREFIFDLRPMMLDDLGLNPTLKKSIEDYEQKSGISCDLSISGKDSRLPSHTEVTIFRVIQSLLKNVRNHAQATHVQISLDVTDERASVVVEDDGTGFNVDDALGTASASKAMGLRTMKEQVEMLGGDIDIDSAPGRGTHVEFWVPVG